MKLCFNLLALFMLVFSVAEARRTSLNKNLCHKASIYPTSFKKCKCLDKCKANCLKKHKNNPKNRRCCVDCCCLDFASDHDQ